MEEKHNTCGDFILKPTAKVICISQRVSVVEPTPEGSVKANQNNMGAIFPSQRVWDTSGVVKLVWVVHWTSSGLMPVRPLIITLGDFKIPAKHALKVCG